MQRHAKFYAANSPDIIAGFQLENVEKPVIYMVADDGEGLIEYQGEMLEMNLSQWVLKNTSPDVNELTVANVNGKYQFLFNFLIATFIYLIAFLF